MTAGYDCRLTSTMGRVGFIQLLLWACCLISWVANQQFVNIVRGKSYSQINTFHYKDAQSSNAANGNTSGHFDRYNCIHTDVKNLYTPDPNDTYHWWQVDLGETYRVYNITVWARSKWNSRLYPFTITVDNKTCVNVTSPPSTRNNSLTCSSVMYGQVVRLTLTTTHYMLNLCEFQIFDCREGFYGLGCSSSCATNCAGGCNRTSGFCTRCQSGYHGDQCTSPCSSLRSRCTQCSQGGTCTACTGHFMPPACTGCKAGYHGDQCTSRCSSLSSRCTQCSQGGTCTACTGHFMLPACTECVDRYYKQTAATCIQCQGTCDNNTPCDKTTGHCEKCPPGKKGNTCNQECDGGQYGPSRCSLSCGQCEDGQQCHPVTGHCPRCQPGFYPPLCDEACGNNTYGENCGESCGQCKGGQPCDTVTGSCTTGCEPGYTGELCIDTCEAGLYGAGCNETCGHCQVNTTCHHQHGQCLGGCAPGFTGHLCVKLDEGKGSWVIPVVGSTLGAAIITIGLVAIVCWCRRSRAGSEDNQSRTTPPAEDVKEQENNYDSFQPNSKPDPDRDVYTELALFRSEVTTSSNNAD